MTIYTRKYPDFGGMTSVLILTYEDTGLLSGCLLDYSKSGRLTGIHPGEKISPGELERNWTMMTPLLSESGRQAPYEDVPVG